MSHDQLRTMEAVLNFENFRQAPSLDAKAQSALLRPNLKLEYAISNSAANGLPPISVLPMSGQLLSILTQLMGVTSVLEIGTLGGYSSICFAEAGAKVTSIEIVPKHRDTAMENVQGLDVEVLLGAAEDVLPKLAEEGRKFDMVFIDADMDGQWEQFDWAVKLTRPNGCVFLDDVVASMFKNGEMGEGSESILTKIGRDERVKATLVPTVASHSMLPTPVFNGFILAMVKGSELKVAI
ncbi:S-adenosyl-L-methionine-dependent methyltransferase [Ilyonectria robusta]|uniref:S-adenosyl-L-methionine-dependent methyltransferase n=1 Tax=Ilyonectria robusta TaxID=1079257 RepID=UPI001E8DE162|nr:S-adenosyl-L-methionine-dependent methyltransferase [Ilyonectria robusta]KAH8657345.1 S-adenosyl-L-methionine-dependent methyltransferase [Ilyonectria robusta]